MVMAAACCCCCWRRAAAAAAGGGAFVMAVVVVVPAAAIERIYWQCLHLILESHIADGCNRGLYMSSRC